MGESYEKFFSDFLGVYTHPWVIVWLSLEWVIIFTLILLFRYRKNGSFFVFFDLMFEKIHLFFEDILWSDEKKWIKIYITSLFFVIIFSNFLGVFLEFLTPIFWHGMEYYVKIPTADINFNVAMAVIWVVIVILEQFKFLWIKKALYEYFPIFWKDYIPYQKGVLSKKVDFFLFPIVKVFDIIISVFLGLLEIIGHLAKIISLSFRLFWNMTSGGILLAMIFAALGWLTVSITGWNFPVLGPIILYLQEFLVALIQALVFPLLLAIFIKVSKAH